MRKIINILVLLILSQFSLAQIDLGNYSNESDYFNISNDSVCFDLTRYDCLITHIRGCGDYRIIDDYLFIETQEDKGEKSTFEKLQSENDFLDISVTDSGNEPLVGVNIICNDSLGNTITGAATNKEGLARIENQKNIDIIRIVYLACDEVEFKFDSGFDYQVRLVEGNVIEHQTVVFEIISTTTNRLKLSILDTDFKTKRDTIKTLRKIKRHYRKHNRSVNELEKTVANTRQK